MQLGNRIRPSFDELEQRLALAVNIAVDGFGNLLIENAAGAPLIDRISIQGIGADNYDIYINGAYQQTENVLGNITIDLSDMGGTGLDPAGVIVDFDLVNDENLEGNLSVLFAEEYGGSHAVFISSDGTGSIIGDGGADPGNVTIRTGTGADLVSIGFLDFALFGGPLIQPVDINGSVLIDTGANDDLVETYGGTIGGNMSVTDANIFALGDLGGANPTTLGGSLTYNNSLDTTNVSGIFAINEDSIIQKSVTVTTNLRNDSFLIDSGVEIWGAATFNMGHGVNSFEINNATLFTSLRVTGGNQRDDINLGPGAEILGNCTFTLGSSGTTAATRNDLVIRGTIMGGNIVVYGGNGVDRVNYNAAAVGAYLQAYLYGGNDTFILGANTILARAYIDGGAGIDTFTNNLGVIAFPFALRNFP
jgi:hypothetical protein